MVDPTREKRCGKCRETKSVSEFNRDRHNKDGFGNWCKSCWRQWRASRDYDVDPAIREKRCSRCKQIRPVEEFSPYRKSKDGLGSWCKPCANEHGRERGSKLNYDIDQTISEKYCSRCKGIKPVGEFDRQRRSRDGLQKRCRACMREVNHDWHERNKEKASELRRVWVANNPERVKAIGRKGHLKKEYGLSLEDYDQLVKAQDGKCVCGSMTKPLHVDHDHKTGAVRGLLCGPCNRTIGMALESPERLMALVRYLEIDRGE